MTDVATSVEANLLLIDAKNMSISPEKVIETLAIATKRHTPTTIEISNATFSGALHLQAGGEQVSLYFKKCRFQAGDGTISCLHVSKCSFGSINISDCEFIDGIDFTEVRCAELTIENCRVTQESDRPWVFRRITASLIDVRNLKTSNGGFKFVDGVVNGSLKIANLEVLKDESPGISISQMSVAKDVEIKQCKGGAITAVGNVIGNNLELSASKFKLGAKLDGNNVSGDLLLLNNSLEGEMALSAQGISIKGSIRITSNVKKTTPCFGGRMDFSKSNIGGSFEMSNIAVNSESPVSISLNRSNVADAVSLYACDLNGAIDLTEAKLVDLGVKTSIVGRGAQSIIGTRTSINGHVEIDATILNGVAEFNSVEVARDLRFINARLYNANVAVLATSLTVGGSLVIDGAIIDCGIEDEQHREQGRADSELGAIRNIALSLRSVRVSGDFTIADSRIFGDLRLESASIGGKLSIHRGTEIECNSLLCDRALVEGAVDLSNSRFKGYIDLQLLRSASVNFYQTEVRGTVDLVRAEIEQYCQFAHSKIDQIECAGLTSSTISFVRAEVGGPINIPYVKLSNTLDFTGSKIEGSISAQALECHRILLTDAEIVPKKGSCAIDLSHSNIGLIFGGRVKLRGSLRMPNSTVRGLINLWACVIDGYDGFSLDAYSSEFGKSVLLHNGVFNSAIDMRRSVIKERLDLSTAKCRSADAARVNGVDIPEAKEKVAADSEVFAIVLLDAQVNELRMPESADVRTMGAVDLQRAKVRVLTDCQDGWPVLSSHGDVSAIGGKNGGSLKLSGCEYQILHNPAALRNGSDNELRTTEIWKERVRWLELQSEDHLREEFLAQPWEQLAHALARGGYVEDAKKIWIERFRRERLRRNATFITKVTNYILDGFVSFGLNPWRSVPWMAAAIALFAVLWSATSSLCKSESCTDNSVFVTSKAGDLGSSPYPRFNGLMYSIDAFLPIVEFGYQEKWQPNMELRMARYCQTAASCVESDMLPRWLGEVPLGGILYWVYLLEVLLGFVMASISITAFAGLLYGTSRG